MAPDQKLDYIQQKPRQGCTFPLLVLVNSLYTDKSFRMQMLYLKSNPFSDGDAQTVTHDFHFTRRKNILLK